MTRPSSLALGQTRPKTTARATIGIRDQNMQSPMSLNAVGSLHEALSREGWQAEASAVGEEIPQVPSHRYEQPIVGEESPERWRDMRAETSYEKAVSSPGALEAWRGSPETSSARSETPMRRARFVAAFSDPDGSVTLEDEWSPAASRRASKASMVNWPLEEEAPSHNPKVFETSRSATPSGTRTPVKMLGEVHRPVPMSPPSVAVPHPSLYATERRRRPNSARFGSAVPRTPRR
mmetsp:Transcript_53712/g.167913  ORF Transcript_53712/g.167913 Transcript_53712/m.167913 type:complete len:235 (-) Transcript_53712:49-753(-)